MGTRMHKIMGYGGKHPDRETLFNRIAFNGKDGEVAELLDTAIDARENASYGMCLESLKWAKATGNRWPDEPEYYPNRFEEIVKYAAHPDRDDGNWIIIKPTQYKKMFRYNDDLDIIANFIAGYELDDQLIKLKTGIYPYHQTWMNAITGERISNYNSMTDDPMIVPYVPDAIRVIALHLGFDYRVLRPMYAVWWC